MVYMNKALKLDPDYAEAHFNLGYAHKQQGNFEQSIQHFHEAQRTNPVKFSITLKRRMHGSSQETVKKH